MVKEKINIPNHIAIIMDGNGRWAKSKGLVRHQGHKEGKESAKEIVKTCAKLGVKNLTLFAFSTENWKRPKKEVDLLMDLLYNSLMSELKELKDNNIPIIISGDFNVIPTDDDVYSPENFKNDACAHPLTREQYRILINMGFTDLVKHFVEGKTNWTFWGYRGGGWQKGNGLRIDHFLTTANVTDLVKNVTVNREPRGWEKASDHTPVTITLEN